MKLKPLAQGSLASPQAIDSLFKEAELQNSKPHQSEKKAPRGVTLGVDLINNQTNGV